MKPHEGPPHGYTNGRDLSDPRRSASGDPTSSHSESMLFRAYARMEADRLVADCACGGVIESENDWRAIANAVQEHNRSALHEQWRTWRDLQS